MTPNSTQCRISHNPNWRVYNRRDEDALIKAVRKHSMSTDREIKERVQRMEQIQNHVKAGTYNDPNQIYNKIGVDRYIRYGNVTAVNDNNKHTFRRVHI